MRAASEVTVVPTLPGSSRWTRPSGTRRSRSRTDSCRSAFARAASVHMSPFIHIEASSRSTSATASRIVTVRTRPALSRTVPSDSAPMPPAPTSPVCGSAPIAASTTTTTAMSGAPRSSDSATMRGSPRVSSGRHACPYSVRHCRAKLIRPSPGRTIAAGSPSPRPLLAERSWSLLLGSPRSSLGAGPLSPPSAARWPGSRRSVPWPGLATAATSSLVVPQPLATGSRRQPVAFVYARHRSR